jgi:hypothetical protein
MDNPETLKTKRECSDNEGPTSSPAKKTKLSYGNSEPRGSIEKRKLAYDAYTVGWICVLRSELNASRALLDEEHDRLPPANNDDNSYLLGRMGEHNIVIAFPGSGTYGMSAASQTATNMVRTFRNIRFGLMVGVGGGAPKHPDPNDPLRDIRLGDVIVSIPKGSHGKHNMNQCVRVFEFIPLSGIRYLDLLLIMLKVVFFNTIWESGRTIANFILSHTWTNLRRF